MGAKRSYSAGRFALDIDGSVAGFCKKVSGGVTKGEVVSHNLGTDLIQRKHLATITHEPLTAEISMGMGKPMWEWIKASLDKGHITKNLALMSCDFDYKVQNTREYINAYVQEVAFPALDGSSKEPGYFTIKMDPEQIRYMKGDDKVIQGDQNVSSKTFLCSNFRMQLGDLPTQKLAKIDAFTWKQGTKVDEVGQFREYEKIPTKIEVPNLKLTISMRDLDPWAQWHKSFVIDGKCTDGDELSGSITLLGPDMTAELMTINLAHVGIISLEQGAAEANKEEIARFTVELYVEEMTIDTYNT